MKEFSHAVFASKIQEIVKVDADEIARFFLGLRKVSVTKGDYIMKAGDVSNAIFFVTRGLLRTFLAEEDKEIVTDFFFEHDFAGTFTSFLARQVTSLNIQALEDSEVIEITSEALDAAYDANPAWLALGKYIFEIEFLKKRKREHSFLRLDARQRYFALLEQYPQIGQRVSLKDISSHLRIQPESLSRIRSGKYNRN